MLRRTLAVVLAASGLSLLPGTPAKAATACTSEAPQGTVTVTYCDDVTPPLTVLDGASPAANAAGYTRSSTRTFTFHDVVTDGDPDPMKFECALDGSAFADCQSGITLTGLGEGPHTFVVRAYDSADRPIRAQDCTTIAGVPCTDGYQEAGDTVTGDAGASRTVTWTVDTTTPDTFVVDSPYDLDFPDAPLTTTDPVRIGLSSSERPQAFRCTLDGSSVPCGTTATLRTRRPGVHTLVAASVDRAGNVDASPETASFFVPLNITRPSRLKALWKRTTGAAYVGHDLVTARRRGAVLTLGTVSRVRGIQLVAPCGPAMGAFRLRIGLNRSMKVSQRCAHATSDKVYLVRSAWNMALSGTVKITTLGSRPVSLDAVALRH